MTEREAKFLSQQKANSDGEMYFPEDKMYGERPLPAYYDVVSYWGKVSWACSKAALLNMIAMESGLTVEKVSDDFFRCRFAGENFEEAAKLYDAVAKGFGDESIRRAVFGWGGSREDNVRLVPVDPLPLIPPPPSPAELTAGPMTPLELAKACGIDPQKIEEEIKLHRISTRRPRYIKDEQHPIMTDLQINGEMTIWHKSIFYAIGWLSYRHRSWKFFRTDEGFSASRAWG